MLNYSLPQAGVAHSHAYLTIIRNEVQPDTTTFCSEVLLLASVAVHGMNVTALPRDASDTKPASDIAD